MPPNLISNAPRVRRVETPLGFKVVQIIAGVAALAAAERGRRPGPRCLRAGSTGQARTLSRASS
jgi:hypothetical protein